MRSGERTARHVTVRGIVQGVAFRHWTTVKARELGVGGWVRNRLDGSVEVFAEGEQTAVEALVAWLAKGPPAARVTGTLVEAAEPEGASSFEVRATAPS